MAHSTRPVVQSRPVRAVRRRSPLFRLLAAGLVSGLAYAGLMAGGLGSGTDLVANLPGPLQVASASLAPTEPAPVSTNAFDHLFSGAAFNGPNRAAKSDRYRPPVDVLAFASRFEETRLQLAALRKPADPTDLAQSRLAAAEEAAPVEEGPRMSVASINPAAAAALDAIAGIAPPMVSATNPVPLTPSEQLAYARANTPATGAYASGEAVEVSDKELWCLSTAIYFEARGESYRGQVAVAQVVLNRVKDHRYPDTICGVVYQNQHRRNSCQFSFACDGIPESINDAKSWAQAQDIARRYTAGELYLTEVGDATHYHATYVRPAWAPRMNKVTQIGLHVFYKFKRGWLFG